MTSEKALTDDGFWDSWWDKGRRVSRRPLLRFHPYYGQYGIYLRILRSHVGPLQGKRVLELGGGGRNFRLLTLNKFGGAQVTAIDFSARALEELRVIFDANGGEVEVIDADITGYDYGDRRYDLITHHGVIEHFSDFRAIFESCRKLLAPGGQMFFTVPNMECIGAIPWARWSPYNWSKHIHHSDELIASVCEETGLVLKKSLYYGLPMLGPPCLEKRNLLSVLTLLVQRANVAVNRIVFPFWDRIGHVSFSSERGFLVHLKEP